MALAPFNKLQHPDQLINRIQDNVSNAVNPVTSIQFLDGQQLTDITLQAGVPTEVSHRLQKPVSNYWVTKLNANAVIWDQGSTSTTITLVASATATINLWVS